MCFSKPKMPEIRTPPAPSPSPVAVVSSESAVANQEERRKKLQNLRMGLASTIKTPGGVGQASLVTPTLAGKQYLGQ
jgi:hypothetical protein